MFPLRDENPAHSFPMVVIGLIVANVAVFAAEMLAGSNIDGFFNAYALIPNRLTYHGRLDFDSAAGWVTLFTSLFLHGGIGHILSNMWFLWIFGDNLEDFLGHFRFLVFYLVCGIAAGLVHVVMNPDSAIPTVGASGAISGVLGGYLILFPHIRIRTLVVWLLIIDVVRVPAGFFLALWFILQIFGGLGAESSIAFAAHIGGFLTGVLFTLAMSKKVSGEGGFERYQSRRALRF